MTLQKWVANNGGPKKVARLLNVSQYTVYWWLRKDGTPRPETIIKLINVSKGKLTLQGILKDSSR